MEVKIKATDRFLKYEKQFRLSDFKGVVFRRDDTMELIDGDFLTIKSVHYNLPKNKVTISLHSNYRWTAAEQSVYDKDGWERTPDYGGLI
jgi:hypothetical protein